MRDESSPIRTRARSRAQVPSARERAVTATTMRRELDVTIPYSLHVATIRGDSTPRRADRWRGTRPAAWPYSLEADDTAPDGSSRERRVEHRAGCQASSRHMARSILASAIACSSGSRIETGRGGDAQRRRLSWGAPRWHSSTSRAALSAGRRRDGCGSWATDRSTTTAGSDPSSGTIVSVRGRTTRRSASLLRQGRRRVRAVMGTFAVRDRGRTAVRRHPDTFGVSPLYWTRCGARCSSPPRWSPSRTRARRCPAVPRSRVDAGRRPDAVAAVSGAAPVLLRSRAPAKTPAWGFDAVRETGPRVSSGRWSPTCRSGFCCRAG